MRQHGARKGGVFCGHPVARTRIVCIHVPPLVAVRDHVAAPRGVRSEGTVRCTFVRGDSGGGVNTSGAEGAGWNRPRGEHGGYCTWGGQEPLRRPILVGGCKHVLHVPGPRSNVNSSGRRCTYARWLRAAGIGGPIRRAIVGPARSAVFYPAGLESRHAVQIQSVVAKGPQKNLRAVDHQLMKLPSASRGARG